MGGGHVVSVSWLRGVAAPPILREFVRIQLVRTYVRKRGAPIFLINSKVAGKRLNLFSKDTTTCKQRVSIILQYTPHRSSQIMNFLDFLQKHAIISCAA